MFIWLQFIMFFVAAIGIVSFPSSRKLAALLSFIFALFATLQLSSYFLGGNLIDYKYFEHVNLKDIWSVKSHYIGEFLIGLVAFIILSFLIYYIGRRISAKSLSKKLCIPIVIASLIGLCFTNGMLANLYEIASLKNADEKSFQTALSDLGIPPNDYITSNEVTAQAGKNIIVISLESLERGFLEAPLQPLTPNLQLIGKEHTYLPMSQNEGSGWTSGSMYTLISGMPAFFKQNGNEAFKNTSSYETATLTDVLIAANYDLTYLIAKKEFSGVDDMLTAFGFTVKSENDFETEYPKSNWGMHDKDLFNEAKKELLEKSSQEQPFALFMSTISGHFPNGIYDDRMANTLPSQDTELEFMTSAVDHYIGELIQFLKENNLYENTAVYLFPDHKLMGNNSPVISKFENKRDLFLISTASNLGSQKLPIYQIDLPRLIIEGAEINTNATFLTDYIDAVETEQFITDNKQNILTANEASLRTGDFRDGIHIEMLKDGTVQLSNPATGYIRQLPNTEKETYYKIDFDEKMRYLKYNPTSKQKMTTLPTHSTVTLHYNGSEMYAFLLQKSGTTIPKFGNTEITFTKEEIDASLQWSAFTEKSTPQPSKIRLKSTGYNDTYFWGPSNIQVGLRSFTLKRGLNLLIPQDARYTVEHYDTFEDASAASDFIERLEVLLSEKIFFAIVAHDSAEKKLEPYSSKLEELGLSELAQLGTREAYVAYKETYGIAEERHPKSVSITLPYKPSTSQEKTALAKDTKRFIAHAGGQIDGHNYTNSLEAMDLNYANGFRLFELDFIKTSDGVYVAAHDWNVWKKHTGYTGETPVSERTFLQYKIKDTYTPLNLNGINTWFKKHPDAFLISDKVNDPKDFSSKFLDKSRLTMELFSVKAIEEAQGLGITIMPTQNIVDHIKGDVVEQLKAWNVQHIAISRRKVAERTELLLQLKDTGIKTYVYHVNFDKGKDEQYVFNYEFDFIYGMYADRWDFGK